MNTNIEDITSKVSNTINKIKNMNFKSFLQAIKVVENTEFDNLKKLFNDQVFDYKKIIDMRINTIEDYIEQINKLSLKIAHLFDTKKLFENLYENISDKNNQTNNTNIVESTNDNSQIDNSNIVDSTNDKLKTNNSNIDGSSLDELKINDQLNINKQLHILYKRKK
jgi:hypothetical protein